MPGIFTVATVVTVITVEAVHAGTVIIIQTQSARFGNDLLARFLQRLRASEPLHGRSEKRVKYVNKNFGINWETPKRRGSLKRHDIVEKT